MDLGKFPGCGEPWIEGTERCDQCGYVPIGAGLFRLPLIVIRRRPTPPGGRGSFLVTLFLLVAIAAAAEFKPWFNDWEPVRVALGDPKAPSIVGTWIIQKDVALDVKGRQALPEPLEGGFTFTDQGSVRITLYRGAQVLDALGSYTLRGDNLVIIPAQKLGQSNAPLPKQVSLTLYWKALDKVAMDVEKQERLTLKRQKDTVRKG